MGLHTDTHLEYKYYSIFLSVDWDLQMFPVKVACKATSDTCANLITQLPLICLCPHLCLEDGTSINVKLEHLKFTTIHKQRKYYS